MRITPSGSDRGLAARCWRRSRSTGDNSSKASRSDCIFRRIVRGRPHEVTEVPGMWLFCPQSSLIP